MCDAVLALYMMSDWDDWKYGQVHLSARGNMLVCGWISNDLLSSIARTQEAGRKVHKHTYCRVGSSISCVVAMVWHDDSGI